jgi:hypothetical protein
LYWSAIRLRWRLYLETTHIYDLNFFITGVNGCRSITLPWYLGNEFINGTRVPLVDPILIETVSDTLIEVIDEISRYPNYPNKGEGTNDFATRSHDMFYEIYQ